MSDLFYPSEEIQDRLNYLQLLSHTYRSAAETATEIINLEAILDLPKGTEHFLADIHGEDEAFRHVLRNASGDIKRRVREILGDELDGKAVSELCTLIYYPAEKLALLRREETPKTVETRNAYSPLTPEWYALTIRRLVLICRSISSKYTRSKVRTVLPKEFSYIIQELLHESEDTRNKNLYVNGIIGTIIDIGEADHFIEAICGVIQRLSVDRLHIVGDIFDRGAGSHLVMDALCDYHNFDIQFGNHDVLWIGAASGNVACMANILRICMRYGNLGVLQDGYGINLLPIATFAMEIYKDDPCEAFGPKLEEDVTCSEKTRRLIAQMHKAISILQFKLEADLIRRHPEFDMDDRLLLDKIDYQRGVCRIGGRNCTLSDTLLPTIDPADPYRLSVEETELVEQIRHSFLASEKLNRHIRQLLDSGSMYLVYNGNLLYHASVPMNADGTFRQVQILEETYSGRALLDRADQLVRIAFDATRVLRDMPSVSPELTEEQRFAIDYAWYLWCGKDSPLFDKDKMTTFERYFLKDKTMTKEHKGAYYDLRDDPEAVDRILEEFDVHGKFRHVINGHTPIHTSHGESPLKAGGKLLVIDGGFSKPYQRETGIAGYTLVYHSRGMSLVQHQPFKGIAEAIREGSDIRSTRQLVEIRDHRILMRDTDKGRDILRRIEDLRRLLFAYREGWIKEGR